MDKYDPYLEQLLLDLTEPIDGTSGLLKEFQAHLRAAMTAKGWIKPPPAPADVGQGTPDLSGPQGTAAEQAEALAKAAAEAAQQELPPEKA